MKKPIFILVLLATILISANMTMAQKMDRIRFIATGEYLQLDQQKNELVANKNAPNDSSSWFILEWAPKKKQFKIRVSVNGKYLREDEQSGKIVSTDNISDDFSSFLLYRNPKGKGWLLKIIGSKKWMHFDGKNITTVSGVSSIKERNKLVIDVRRVVFGSRTEFDPANQVTFFAGENYKGESLAPYVPGNYPSMRKLDFNDRVSSIKLGRNVAVQICQDANFNGNCEYIFADTPSINSTLVKNKQVSSFRLLTKEMASRFVKQEEAKDDPPSPSFKECSDEGKRCNFSKFGKMVQVAYGSYGRFKYKYFNTDKSRSVQCNTSSFGDPITKGPNKCWVTVLALDPSPTPIPKRTPIRVTPITPTISTSTTQTVAGQSKNNTEPIYVLRNGKKCVELNGTKNYSRVKLSNCNSDSNQKWVFVESPDSPTFGEIRTLNNKCLTSVAESRGYLAMLTDCDGGSFQRWQFTGNGELKKESRCLNSNSTGNFIPLTNCSGALNQRWSFDEFENTVAQSNASMNNSSNSNSNSIPVVMPSGSNLRLVNTSFTNSPMLNAYLREKLPGLLIRPAAPIQQSYSIIQNFDFALDQQNTLFYMKSDYLSYGFVTPRAKRVRIASYSSPSKLVTIGGTDSTFYRKAGRQRSNTNLYGLTADGRILQGTFDGGSHTLPSNISFRLFAGNNRFHDIAFSPEWEGMLALTDDSRLLKYSNYKWSELARTNFVKFVPGVGQIFGLTANNQLFVTDNNGRNPVKLLDDVKDFSVRSQQGVIYHISSKTNLLIKSRYAGRRIVDTPKVDEKGTFVRFITKNSCVVQNGNGQVFICQ